MVERPTSPGGLLPEGAQRGDGLVGALPAGRQFFAAGRPAVWNVILV